ncbi:hypothetical protein SEA_PAELLA_225 [Arthrobacter phage Paella]|nr:hypothetical protein SEA_PAELLA_225 [Arthrobacter phage Paella]
MSDAFNEWWDEMSKDTRTPEQKAHAEGYTAGYKACEAETRRKAGLLQKFIEDDISKIWRTFEPGETLATEEAIRIWQEMSLVMESHPNGGLLLGLYDKLTRELTQGERCGVCGRYKDSECAIEC